MAATGEHYRSQKTLDVVFAGSCAAMLLTTIWMFAQDYNRDYKGVQRTFRDVEATLAEREMIDKLPDPELVNEKRRAVRDAKRDLREAKKSVASEERKLTARHEKADEEYRGIKADLDAESTYYNIAADDAGKYPKESSQGEALRKKAQKIREKRIIPLEENLANAKKKLDEIDAEIKENVTTYVEGPEKALAAAEDDLKKTTVVFDRFAKLSAQKAWSTGDTLRTLPIMDGFESPTKVRQLWLPQLTIDMGGFKDAARYDRCTTCHLGIDRGTFEREALDGLGDEDRNRRLVNKLESAHTMLEKRKNSGEKLGFDPDDLPGETSGSMTWIVFSMLGCVLVGAVSLGVLTQSGRVGLYLLTGGLVMTLVTSGAFAFFAPRRPAIKTIKLDESQVTQYASHPRLDLFVDANSPHPGEKFGCTICHAGQGSATDFNLATHTPNDESQTHRWQKDYHYHATHDWDFPMLPKRFIESSCVKCHHQVTDLIRHGAKEEAPKLLRGYNLVKDMGCFGCHEIQGIMKGRSIGPDIRLESAPALDELTSAEQEKATSDPANPPGNMRKVGPSLRRLAEKTNEEWTTHWVASPRGFRPDTKMPHFFNQSTIKKENLPEDQKNFPAVEIHAISHYLIHESKASLEGKDIYRQGLLAGKESLDEFQGKLIKSGLSDKELKDLFDVSKRFTDLAILSAPLQNSAINADSTRQRLLQERLSELHRRVAGGTPALIAQAKQDIESTGKELQSLTNDIVAAAKPVPISSRILGEDGEVVTLPAGEGNKANGQRLFAEKGCMACHQHEGTLKKTTGPDKKPIPAVQGVSNFGPDLSRVADKLMPVADRMTARTWLVQWILNPNVYHPRTKMPITHLKVSDANDVATWLLSQKTGWKGDPTDPAAPSVTDIKKLARVYLEKAPAITKADAEAFLPKEGTSMPGIPKERLADMVREADERRLEAGNLTVDDLKWYVGKKAIARLGCFGCHDIPGFETAKPIGVGLNDWGKKDHDRLAFEDGDNFAKRHFNIVPTRITRGEVEKRIKVMEAKEDRTRKENKELDRLKKQAGAQERIHKLEAEALDTGLSAKEAHELEDLKPLQFFEPVKDAQGHFKRPYEGAFYHSLEHHQREGFLDLKLAEPRSYDYNRIRAWDDRLRMPQFKFARSKRLAGESEEDFLSRSDKAEAEAREAVMTFILGLVAEPIPTQYVHAPKPEKQAEIVGRQVLDKFNCASCHLVRSGVYEFKLTDPILTRDTYGLQATQKNDMEREAPIDHVFLNHNAWFGTGGGGDRLTAIGVYDDLASKTLQDGGENSDVIRLTDALRFFGKDRVMRDLPAGNSIYLPVGSYQGFGPFGGTWTESMIAYLGKRDSTNYPKTDPGKARSALPPPLVREGERVQPDWLYKFLLNPKPIRPESYMLLRMPKFNMSPEESRALVNYFSSVSRLTNPGAGVSAPYVTIEQRNEEYWKRMTRQYEGSVKAALTSAEAVVKKMEADLDKLKKGKESAQTKKAIADQEKTLQPWSARVKLIKAYIAQPAPKKGKVTDLYSVQAYQLLTNKNLCLKCHPVGNITIEGPQGPNLTLASERLRPEWMEEWISHPKRMFTYAPVMPQNFPNDADPLKWQWQDSFVGTPIQQTRAVRDLLMDLPRLNELIANVPPAPTPPPEPTPKGDKK